jgi:hypothetical protein
LSNDHYNNIDFVEARNITKKIISALVSLGFFKDSLVYDTSKSVFENLVALFEDKLKYKVYQFNHKKEKLTLPYIKSKEREIV